MKCMACISYDAFILYAVLVADYKAEAPEPRWQPYRLPEPQTTA